MDGSSREQFEQAVLVSFNQNMDGHYRNAALTSLTQLKQAEGSWRFIANGLLSTQQAEVKFWCLQALCELVYQGRYASFAQEDVVQLQHAVFSALENVTTDEAAFIKNKLAQLIVVMLEADYPDRWTHFFPRLLPLLSAGDVAVDLFLRILGSLHEEVLSPESGGRSPEERLHAANRIKDAMRVEAIGHVVEAWYAIMLRTFTTGDHVDLCHRALLVSRFYIPWMDIGLMANDRFLPMLLHFAKCADLHSAACGALTELVIKGMEPAPKLAHLAMLNLTPTLTQLVEAACAEDVDHESVLHPDMGRQGAGSGGGANGGNGDTGDGVGAGTGDADQGGISAALATLVCALATELLECWEKLGGDPKDASGAGLGSEAGARAYAYLRSTLPLVLCVLQSEDENTSHTAAPFLHAYLTRLRRASLGPGDLEPHRASLQRALLVVTRRLCYPVDYCFDDPDEAEEDFQTYRRDLATLFKAVARVDREGTLSFTADCLARVVERDKAAVPFQHAEVVIYLVYQLGEGLPTEAFRMENSVFTRMLVVLLHSGLSAYPHRAVQLLFFETVVRYVRFFQVHPAYVAGALEALCDARGLHNVDCEVRGRVCYLLLRFVKSMNTSAGGQAVGAGVGPPLPGGGSGGAPPLRVGNGSAGPGESAGGGGGSGEAVDREARGGQGLTARSELERCSERILVAIEPLLRAAPLRDDAVQRAPGMMAENSAAAAAKVIGGQGAQQDGGARVGGGAGSTAGVSLAVAESEQLHLVETAGVLLGGGFVSADVAPRLLLLLLAPLSERLAQLRAAQLQRRQRGLDALSRRVAAEAAGQPAPDAEEEVWVGEEADDAWAAAHMTSALATLSKGFTQASAQAVAGIFASSLEAALETAVVYCASPELRRRVVMLLHRMVECLGEAVLPYLQTALPPLLAHSVGAELHEVVTLANQVVARFKRRAYDLMANLLPTLTRSLFDAIGVPPPGAVPPRTPVSETDRERGLMFRFYLTLVHGLVHNGLEGIFLHPTNRPSLDQFLSVILKGAVDSPDAQMQKQCVSVLHKLVESWAMPPDSGAQNGGANASVGLPEQGVQPLQGFDSYALSHVAPALVQALVHPYLDLKDASSVQLLEALAAAQQAMYAALGARYSTFLLESALPALGASHELATSYVQNVVAANPPRPFAFRDFLRSFVENYRASRQQVGVQQGNQ